MEAFSLLRYWRTNGVDATKNDSVSIPTAVSSQSSETDDDHGPFFDLEFSLPGDEIGVQELVKHCEENENEEEEDESDGSDESEEEEEEDDDDDDESELKLTSVFQCGSSGDVVSDDLLEMKSNPPPPSRATKLRVMMLKLKKPKLKAAEEDGSKPQKDEKRFSKKAMQEYLRKVKPRYGGKFKFTGQLIKTPKPKKENESISNVSEPPLLKSTVLGLKQGNLPPGLRVVCKHLRKSRSAVTAAPPGPISSNRRDDSLLQQQDGIQSAILHCKRSFKASRDSDCSSSSATEPTSQDSKCENDSNSDAERLEMNKS